MKLTVSEKELSVDNTKTETIAKWPPPTSVKELQSFLGLAGFYRRFIFQFAHIVLPLSHLVKKNSPWIWSTEQEDSFVRLKSALQAAPVLILPNFSRPFVLTTDASGSCVGGVLS